MNLSSFAIGAFLSHAAKAHGDMGGTKHFHYLRLSSAGLLLASSLLLAPTVTAQTDEDVQLSPVFFSTRIGNCDVDDFYIEGYEFPNPPSVRCLELPVQGGNAITTPTFQVIPNVFTAGVFGDDSRFTDDEFTLEVDGPCSINGIPNPGFNQPRDQNCGLQIFPNAGFFYNDQAYNLDQGVSLTITDVGNDMDEFVDNYGICYVPTEDSVPSLTPEVCTIKVTRTQVVTDTTDLCIPPPDFGTNCFRSSGNSYFTPDEEIDESSPCAPNNCLYGPCIQEEVCAPAACGQGCGPTGCGVELCNGQFQGCTTFLWGSPCPFGGVFGCPPVNECPLVCSNKLVEDSANKESFPCEEIVRPITIPNPPTSTFTIEVEIDTSGNFGECGDGFCLAGDASNCDDCANFEILRNIAVPPAFVPPFGPTPPSVIPQDVLNRVKLQNGLMFEIKNELEYPVQITELSFFALGGVYKQDGTAPLGPPALSDPNNYDLPGQQSVQVYSLVGSFVDGSAASQSADWTLLYDEEVDFDEQNRWRTPSENEQNPLCAECTINPITGTTNSDMKNPIPIVFNDVNRPDSIEAGGTLSLFLFTEAQIYTETGQVTDSGARVVKLGTSSIIQETPFSGLENTSAGFFGRIGYNISPPDTNEVVALFFQAIDTEKDGVVSFSEFKGAEEAAAERVGIVITEDEIEAQFEEVDKNDDGVIDLEEAQASVTQPVTSSPVSAPTPPPNGSRSKSNKSPPKSKGIPCAKIKGKKAKRNCLSKLKKPF